MADEFKCPTKKHTLRLRPDLYWRKTRCPKCDREFDRLRMFRFIAWLKSGFQRRTGSSKIPDEVRYADIRIKADKLIQLSWTDDSAKSESFDIPFAQLRGEPPNRIVSLLLDHVRRIAPKLNVPVQTPRIFIGTPKDAGGQFRVIDGTVSMTLSAELVEDRSATAAVLAHEVCHYILDSSGLNEEDNAKNERLTDVCMFVFGFGEVFYNGYKTETQVGEYRRGHRLGYLKDVEYSFLRRYVAQRRSGTLSNLDSETNRLRRQLLARTGDQRVADRLLKKARTSNPELSENELFEMVLSAFR